MPLSSSSQGIRRFLNASSFPALQLQRQWCSSHASQGFSSTPDGDESNDVGKNSNVPPLTTPKLFISGLSRLTTDEKLKSAFSPFGQLLEAKVVTDRVTGRSKGFGFVGYASIEEAEKAREEMNAKFLDGWVIFVDPAKPRERKSQPSPHSEHSENGYIVNKTIGWCG